MHAVAADLAAKGWLSPSNQPYLPGSIAAMLRRGPHFVDAVAPAIVDDDPDVENDIKDDMLQPAGDAVDAVPTPLALPVPDVDAEAAPVFDGLVKLRWQLQRTQNALVDFRSLMLRLSDFPHFQEAAMASAGLRVDQMGLLAERGDWRECVANWLSRNT